MLGRENLISREEVERLQELRGTYGIKAPAPICAGSGALGDAASAGADPADLSGRAGAGRRRARGWCPTPIDGRAASAKPDGDGEIRLTYRELSALIEDAIRSLR